MNKTVAIIFTGTFAICLVMANYFNYFFAEQSLKRDAEQLLFQFHDALEEASKALHSLPSPDEFECTEDTKQLLSEINFRNPAIRNLTIIHGNEQYCSSSNLTLVIEKYREHKLDAEYDLASIQHQKGDAEFLMVRHHGDSKYILSIDPFMVNYLAEFACSNCLDYRFTIHGEPELVFQSEFQNTESSIQYQVDKREGNVDLTLVLHATQPFLDHYKGIGWLGTLVFALLFASCVAFLSYKLMSIRQSMEHLIQAGLRGNEFVPFYQPIVDSRNGNIVGLEVLARWIKPDGTIIPPYQFIPYAEDNGHIIAITEQLIGKVAQDLVTLNWRDGSQFASVNIVPEHLNNEDLYQQLHHLCQLYQLSPNCFSLEITERKQIKDLESAKSSLKPFFTLGMSLKLDDAGTGYGGFSYIQELGISTLKIDKMFVDTINQQDVKSQVLDAIIDFAHNSNLHSIAEGVETQEQVEYLQQKDVFFIQGYVYAKPMPIEQLHQWLGER